MVAGRRCCDRGDLAVPSRPRLQGVASALLGAWRAEEEEALGSWVGTWAGVAENSISPWLHCKVAPGWHPAGVHEGLHGRPGRSWCGTAAAVPLLPPRPCANPVTAADP